ncbi:MAG TPA: terminase B, partial [Dehalococcoidia bacterium]|nr:terminase B [Dehalococcoidia bacterium]
TALQSAIFGNLRAEGYWKLRERFASGLISIPADNQLMGELAAMRYSYDSQGRVLMESKDEMRGRGLPSPDRADALMLAFLEPAAGAKLWT